MTAPTKWYVNGMRTMMRAGLGIAAVSGTVKFMLLHDTYVIDQDLHDFINDVSANEATGTGYSAGGLTLAGVTVTADAATNASILDFTDISGISVNCCYGVLYVDTGTPSTSPIFTVTDFSNGDATDQIITSAVLATNGYAALTAA